MKGRYLQGVGLVAAIALAMSGGSALAAKGTGSQSPQVKVKFKAGKPMPMEGTRFDGAYVASSKRVYFLGMRLIDDSTTGEVWYYDVGAKKYVDTGTAMPVPVSNYSISPLTDKTGDGLYIFGGRDANAGIVNAVQVYYPDTNKAAQLSKKDNYPGTTDPSGCISLPAMGVATVDNHAVVLGGVAFSANGCAGDENSDQTWVFDPKAKAGKKWAAGPKLSIARGYITTAILGGKIYAIGGDINDAATLIPQSIVESWKPFSGKWSDKNAADLPEACDESQAFGFDSGKLANTITLAGCGQWPNDLPDVLQYDGGKDSWSTVGTLLESRRNHAGANIGSDNKPQLFVVGGYAADGATALATSEIGTAGKGPIAPRGSQVVRSSAARTSLL